MSLMVLLFTGQSVVITVSRIDCLATEWFEGYTCPCEACGKRTRVLLPEG